MGVTGAIFKGLTFDGEDSKDYGVYITGQAVYNSPERDVEMISIPGRDGAFALDRGRFSNIEVTYPAGLFGVDAADFAQAIADFRNMLGSRVGYCRLEDEYNPGEYREAVFKAGVEVTPASLESGQFDIVFECKPQRWLTSGEAAVALSSGDDITNPTLFDSKPLIVLQGYGALNLGADVIEVGQSPLGEVEVGGGDSWSLTASYNIALSNAATLLNVGDPINFSSVAIQATSTFNTKITSATVISSSNMTAAVSYSNKTLTVRGKTGAHTLTYGTSDTWTAYVEVRTKEQDGSITEQNEISLRFTYNGTDRITIQTLIGGTYPCEIGAIFGNSSKNTLAGKDIYIDLDIGEAYIIEGGEIVSVNGVAIIPAILPTLPPGNTTITFDNTITDFEISPRWWQL